MEYTYEIKVGATEYELVATDHKLEDGRFKLFYEDEEVGDFAYSKLFSYARYEMEDIQE